MKYELFKNLLEKATRATPNICAKFGHGYWGDEIPDNIANNIEKIVSFLQSKIEEGYFCKKDEFLMICEGEALINNINNLFSLNIVVRPIGQIEDLNNFTGEPLQLIVNNLTGEIGNTSYGFAQLGFPEEAGEEKSVIYGSYKDSSFSLNYFFKDIYSYLYKEEKVTPICFSYQPKASIGLKEPIESGAMPTTPESSVPSICVL